MQRALATTKIESDATAREVREAVQLGDAATRDAVIESTVAVRSAIESGKEDALDVEKMMKDAAVATSHAERAADRSMRLSARNDKAAMLDAAAKARIALQQAVSATVDAARAADKAAKESWNRDLVAAAAP
jgi:hypothetical protein